MTHDRSWIQKRTDPEGYFFDGQEHINPEEPNSQAREFYSNLHKLVIPIYPGNVKFTKLTFVMRLLHFKSRHGCSDTGFDELLSLIAEVLPDDHTLPLKYYHVEKMVKELNLGYDKIHACENDCMYFMTLLRRLIFH